MIKFGPCILRNRHSHVFFNRFIQTQNLLGKSKKVIFLIILNICIRDTDGDDYVTHDRQIGSLTCMHDSVAIPNSEIKD